MVTTSGPRRGEVWWAIADKRRPVVVVQAEFLNRSSSPWILSVPLTSQLHREGLPGNVRLSRRASRLDRPSIANVAQVAPLPRSGFKERVALLDSAVLARIDAGLALVLELDG